MSSMMGLMEAKALLDEYMRPRPITRRSRPHLRCGICQEPFEAYERTVYLDDERCHQACAQDDDNDR